jgi:hypothetical protein
MTDARTNRQERVDDAVERAEEAIEAVKDKLTDPVKKDA